MRNEFAIALAVYTVIMETAPDWGVLTSERATEWLTALENDDPAAWRELNQDPGADALNAGMKPENFEVPGSIERIAAVLAVRAARDALLMAEGTAADFTTHGLY